MSLANTYSLTNKNYTKAAVIIKSVVLKLHPGENNKEQQQQQKRTKSRLIIVKVQLLK